MSLFDVKEHSTTNVYLVPFHVGHHFPRDELYFCGCILHLNVGYTLTLECRIYPQEWKSTPLPLQCSQINMKTCFWIVSIAVWMWQAVAFWGNALDDWWRTDLSSSTSGYRCQTARDMTLFIVVWNPHCSQIWASLLLQGTFSSMPQSGPNSDQFYQSHQIWELRVIWKLLGYLFHNLMKPSDDWTVRKQWRTAQIRSNNQQWLFSGYLCIYL